MILLWFLTFCNMLSIAYIAVYHLFQLHIKSSMQFDKYAYFGCLENV